MKNNQLFVLTLAIIATLGLSACHNTWHGAGQDVERMGETMQDSVE